MKNVKCCFQQVLNNFSVFEAKVLNVKQVKKRYKGKNK